MLTMSLSNDFFKFVTEVACWWNIICTHLSNVCFCFLFTNKMQTFTVTVLFLFLKLIFNI